MDDRSGYSKRLLVRPALMTSALVLVAIRHAWVAVPGIALLTAADYLLLPLELWIRQGLTSRASTVAQLRYVLTTLGVIYLLSLFAGHPSHLAFWGVFATGAAIALPVVLLMRRIFSEAT
jgi:hypothetical protein